MKIADVDIEKVSPMMRQYMEIKKNNPDIIIMFRLGDFYEMFFEDAINVSHELELTLTGKNAGLDERIPMCGIPYHAINVYLEKLVENGHKVGICEQLEDPKEAKGVVKRGLTKIVSKGTIMDDSLLENENNYIGGLIDFEHIYSLSYIDLSTGEVNVTLVNHDISSIVSEIVNIGIKELIMDDKCDCLLITGPNMAGKSTYMRQLAIIVIMAQIGSFVPCKSCSIPIFDKIFTRIGASDDLVSGESTFMVEMKEANYALQNATKNSLILFDELGRGTATYDGMSLAYAILEYIHNNIKAKTLFSTHYHELTDLCKKLKRVKNVHVSALEEDGNITFLHKVVEGAVSKSYGINVAGLAKLPNEVIEKAKEVLETYENKARTKKTEVVQTSFNFENQENEIINEIKNLDIINITPLEALNYLDKLKKKI